MYYFPLKDPLIVGLSQDIFRELCQNPGCVSMVQQRLIPTITSILQASPDKIPMGLQSVRVPLFLI